MVKKTIIFKQQFLRKLNLYLVNYDVMEDVHDDDDLNGPKILHRPIFSNWCLLPIKINIRFKLSVFCVKK